MYVCMYICMYKICTRFPTIFYVNLFSDKTFNLKFTISHFTKIFKDLLSFKSENYVAKACGIFVESTMHFMKC